MRINGIGTTYLGVTGRAGQHCHATLWLTFLYLPVVPFARHQLELLPHKGSGYSIRVLGRGALSVPEVAKTYLFGWVIFPIVLLAPLVVAIREVRTALRIPDSLETGIIAGGILWLIVAVWKLADWHEARFHPASSP